MPGTTVSLHQRRRTLALCALNLSLLTLALVKAKLRRKRFRRLRKWYMKPLNVYRPISSEFHSLVRDMYDWDDAESHREYFRMDEARLESLFSRVEHRLRHRPTHRFPISPAFRFAFTIKCLASGDSTKYAAKTWRIGHQTAWNIIYETCEAIYDVLQPEFLRLPSAEEWKYISSSFWERWQFPLCLGAVDGKHVVIRKPPEAGSSFFNYKHNHSIVLLGIADHDYCLSYVDVGAYGRTSDGGVWANCEFSKALNDQRNPLEIPAWKALPGSNVEASHVFVGDDAFPLGEHLLKPYGGRNRNRSQRIFDMRLSRARRIIENVFGIMVARWQILQRPLLCTNVDNGVRIVKALCAMHNFLRKSDESNPVAERRYVPPFMIDYDDDGRGQFREGTWRNNLPSDVALQDIPRNGNSTVMGKEVRNRIMNFFQTDAGRVPWQDNWYSMRLD